ncbi:hypothetical protein GCM10010269_35830 [Streptomyces humidus]|uniref:Uncharacterized protein n=1 Tax=Streptomyces humidus TaxID=52259 RepID=A0A918L3L6_9ACTN|nr:hypothetical protein GCM10010269_35830 [Streptomyces humidus]
MPFEDRGQRGGDMVVVLDEQQSHPGLLRFGSSGIRSGSPRQACGFATHEKSGHTRVCIMAVTLMDEDAVKRVPVARGFRYPAETPGGRKSYDRCPTAIGS